MFKRVTFLAAAMVALLPTLVLAIGQDMNFPSVPIPEAEYISKSQGGFTVTVPTTWTSKSVGFNDNTFKPAIDVYVEAEDGARPIAYVKVVMNYKFMIGRYNSEFIYHDVPMSFYNFADDERAVAKFDDGGVRRYNGYHYWILYRTWEEQPSRYFKNLQVCVKTTGDEWVNIEFPWEHLRPSYETVTALPLGAYPIANPRFDGDEDEETPLFAEGFENGLGAWSTKGLVAEEGVIGSVDVPEGDRQILLRADGEEDGYATRGELVSFMKTTHGDLHAAGGPGAWAKRGAATREKEIFRVEAGQTLTFHYNFLTNEPAEGAKGDYAFLFTMPDDGGETNIVRIAGDGDAMVDEAPGGGYDRQTGYKSFTYTFPEAGKYTFGFGVINSGANEDESALLIDDIRM